MVSVNFLCPPGRVRLEEFRPTLSFLARITRETFAVSPACFGSGRPCQVHIIVSLTGAWRVLLEGVGTQQPSKGVASSIRDAMKCVAQVVASALAMACGKVAMLEGGQLP